MFLGFPAVHLPPIMREKIVDKAEEMFLRLGFKSITMDDIAKELGVSKKTIYKYFSNKAALVKTATTRLQQEIDDTIREIKSKNYNAIKEEFIVKATFKEMFKNSKTSPMYQLKKYYPEIYTTLKNKELCLFKDCNTDNLEKGIAQGLYRKDLHIDLISNFYFSLIFGVFESDLYGHEMQEVMKIEYEVLEYHIRAIATEKGIEELERQLQTINQFK